MTGEILINNSPTETRVALVENGVLQEVYVERARRRGIVGNIYRGKVVRVLPGMQAAFVDVGLEKAAFIHASDVIPRQAKITANERSNDKTSDKTETIGNLLHEGQSVVVQIEKDPIGTKGARLTTQLSIPSRYLVYMPYSTHVGISQRIEDDDERTRLKELVEKCMSQEGMEDHGGFILRTAAEGVGEEELLLDIRFLRRLWQSLDENLTTVKPPAILYEDLPLALRVLRDLVRPDVEKIRIDSKETLQKAEEFTTQFTPEIAGKLEHYPGERPVFDLYSVEDEIQKALERKVQLKSGGYIIIDQTEAMTTIDVNTGAFVGHRNLEETIFKTNLEASTAIARQLRLRNLGGIIIIDFIDMEIEEHRRQVLRTLEKNLERDHAKTNITGVSELGLVEMTRKRTRESLGQLLSETCRYCQGRGSLKSPETICYEIFREILREARAYNTDTYLVLASQEVVDLLVDEESDNVADLETFIGKTIKFQVEPMYTQEQFDVILL